MSRQLTCRLWFIANKDKRVQTNKFKKDPFIHLWDESSIPIAHILLVYESIRENATQILNFYLLAPPSLVCTQIYEASLNENNS